MGTIAAEMFENDAPILQMDKLIRRIETSGGSRAAKWFDRAEKSFAKMAYEDALKDFDKVRPCIGIVLPLYFVPPHLVSCQNF
jgi:hypothetical protein|eukprot:COSAG02_NODE_2549_length_8556_cov_3.329431_6_plen_83_part_00